MYLRSLTLKNVKRFRDLTLSFEKRDGSPRLWTVVIGENGTGKTTLLQAIALAAGGRDRAHQLVSNPARYRDVREPTSNCLISVKTGSAWLPLAEDDLDFEVQEQWELDLDLTLAVKPDDSLFSNDFVAVPGKVVQTEVPNKAASGDRSGPVATQPGHFPFLVGYGVRRFLPDSDRQFSLENPVAKRLETLFDRGELTATGFNDLLPSTGKDSFSKLLKDALLRIEDLVPDLVDVELRGRGGAFSAKALTESHRFAMKQGHSEVRLPATWLSQGYQGIIAWIADLLGHAALEAERLVPPEEVRGLVLIDEVDLFLHPRWQVTLVKSLKSLFPKVQFVVTTHSPLVLSGLEPDEIVRLQADDEGNIVESKDKRHPALMTGSELYSAFFGVRELYPNELGKDLQRYMFLSSDPYRTDEEDAEMRKIEPTLRAHDLHPDWEPSPRRPLPDRKAARNGSS